MSKLRLLFHPKIVKQIQGLGVLDRKKIRKALHSLVEYGLDHPSLQIKKLHGVESIYRLRVGNIRVIIEFDQKQRIIYIRKLGHRRDIYRNL